MKVNALVLSAVLLAGCASSAEKAAPEDGIVFNVDESSFLLTRECTKDISVDEDETGGVFLSVTIKHSAVCSKKAHTKVFSKIGSKLNVSYGRDVLVEDTLIVSEINATNSFQIPVDNHSLANKLYNSLQTDQ